MSYEKPSARRPLRSKMEESPILPQKYHELSDGRRFSSSSSEEWEDSGDSEANENSDLHHNSNASTREYWIDGSRPRSLSRERSCPSYQPESFQEQGNNNKYILGALALLVFCYFCYFSEGAKTSPVRKNCSFDRLEKEFPMEDGNLWKALKVGIESVLNENPPDPAVYLFLHPESLQPKELIWKIAKTAATCFSPSLKPMEFGTNVFTSEETGQDYGVVIEKYKSMVKGGGALVVANLNEIPGKAARALHAICDVYTPIVRNVVIFMTLTTPAEQVGNPIEIAENILFNIWSTSMKQHELAPLIARVTDQVFRLQST